jgi:hypothetical protein
VASRVGNYQPHGVKHTKLLGRVAYNPSRTSALASAQDWEKWWHYWGEEIGQKDASERFLVDAVALLHQTCIKLARGLRYQMHKLTYNSEGYILGLEEKDPQELTREVLAWYARNKPSDLDRQDERLRFLARAVEGIAITNVRIADEQAAIIRTGFFTVNASPMHQPDELPPGSVEKD